MGLYRDPPKGLGSYSTSQYIWGFPKIRCTFLGVPIIRTIVFWGLYWGPLILGTYHLSLYICIQNIQENMMVSLLQFITW